jgi:hypothetical protein
VIVYKLTIFCCCCFANKSKTTTWENSKQKRWFVYKFYGFCCCAYQNKQNIKSKFFFRMLSYASILIVRTISILRCYENATLFMSLISSALPFGQKAIFNLLAKTVNPVQHWSSKVHFLHLP